MGNVIIDVDIPKTYEAFAQITGATFEQVVHFFETEKNYHSFEKGDMNDESFRSKIREYFQTDLSDDAIDAAWCSLLLDMPKERLDRIKALSLNYRIFLLSNTNLIHIKEICKRAETMGHDFMSLFEIAFLSCEMKLMKPDIEIYKRVLDEANIQPEESLFIDDNEANIKAAASIGIQTIWLNPLNTLLQKLSNY